MLSLPSVISLLLKESHFLSAEECIMAADFQVQHPNPCKLSKDGTFGSKFVTCIVTGKSIWLLLYSHPSRANGVFGQLCLFSCFFQKGTFTCYCRRSLICFVMLGSWNVITRTGIGDQISFSLNLWDFTVGRGNFGKLRIMWQTPQLILRDTENIHWPLMSQGHPPSWWIYYFSFTLPTLLLPCWFELVSSCHFVSICLFWTGDSSNQIHTEAYQVSNQCMSLVKDNCLVPTKDAPELGYIKESTSEQYVPDVFYSVS